MSQEFCPIAANGNCKRGHDPRSEVHTYSWGRAQRSKIVQRYMMKTVIRHSPLGVLAALALAGCGGPTGIRTEASAVQRELTPSEYLVLKDAEKVRYKNVIVRVPANWGGVLLPVDAGPYLSPTDKAVHGGDIGTLMGLYNQSAFELEHPRVKIEYLNFDMWSDNFKSALAVALSAKRAPAYYIARDLPQTIEQGMYADLTSLMGTWDQYANQPEDSIHQGTISGHVYTMSADELGASVIRYRKDWFREAGIFNERGEPGPRSDWTWDDFRKIARKLTDPAKGRYGYCGELSDFQYGEAHGLDSFVPDPTGRHTWVFNAADPDMLASLQAARELVNNDKSVLTSVSTGWFEWHNEFEASHAAMISSFAPHIPGDAIRSPDKFGKDKPFAQTVGMALPPRGPAGYSGLKAITNPIGFDPTLSPAQLQAAFDWCKSYFYGDLFINRMRNEATEARLKRRPSTMYVELLVSTYKHKENLLDRPLDEVFPRDYIDCYKAIRASHAPPLPREFGLKEPSSGEIARAMKAMYSEAISSNTDLKALIARTADLVNTNLLGFRSDEDRINMRRYVEARTKFYQRYYPPYYETVWRQRLATTFKLP